MEYATFIMLAALGVSIFGVGFFIGNYTKAATIRKISAQIIKQISKNYNELENDIADSI